MKELSPAFKIASIFFIFSFIWILASDKTIYFFIKDIETLNFLQTIKGWFFITVTSLIIYALVRKYFQKEKTLREDIEHIFNQTSTPIAVYNSKGEILKINKVWKESTGYTLSELSNMDNCAHFICQNEKEKKQFLEQVFNINQKEDLGEFYIQTKEKKELVWSLSCSPYGNNRKDKIVILTAIRSERASCRERVYAPV